MLKFTKVTGVLAAGVLALMWAVPAQAQATRTWVSGVGDDANPCSRTAPCKTFAGAISKTAAGGEIDVLDPGGYGGVTITKAMTLDGSGGSIGSILVAASPGITVNATSNDTITIRNISFEGVGATTSAPGTFGIRFLVGRALFVQHCSIRNFRDATNGTGIMFNPSVNAKLFVDDTVLSGNGAGANGGGIVVKPSTGVNIRVNIDNTRIDGNISSGFTADTTGIVGANINVAIQNSRVAGNVNGIVATAPSGTSPLSIMVVGVSITGNTGIGYSTSGSQVNAFLSQSTVTGNGTGLNAALASSLSSFKDNRINANTVDGGATGTSLPS